MTSLYRFLLLTLLAAISLVVAISGIYAYRTTAHEIDEIFDAQLAQYTRLVAGSTLRAESVVTPDQAGHAPVGHKYERKIALQVWDQHQQLSSSSAPADNAPAAPFQQGYHDIADPSGKHWKVFVLHDATTGQWYMAAESMAVRKELVDAIARSSCFPFIAGTGIAMLLVHLILVRGLSPLAAIANAISQRKADQLEPLALGHVPAEVSVLVSSIDALLARIRSSLERERRFSADAAHEIKTPLAALKLHLANLVGNLDTPSATDTLHKAQRSSNEIQRLIEQLLVFNRLEPHYFSQNLQTVELSALCRDVLAHEAELALEKQQSLRFDAPDEPVLVRGDAALLAMLLRNLVRNAILYTANGGSIHCTLSATAGKVMIRLVDNGPGIPRAERERVFDRFYRGSGDAHASGVAGSGLGLAIVREIVRLHDGTIRLDDGDAGRGLCVSVELPVG